MPGKQITRARRPPGKNNIYMRKTTKKGAYKPARGPHHYFASFDTSVDGITAADPVAGRVQ